METEILNNNSISKQKAQHFLSLDFIKFILSIIIVFHHFQQCTGQKFANFNFFGGRIYVGYIVEFFFIISGFVCMYGIKHKTTGEFKIWFLNKCSRIYPMTIITVFITAFALTLYRIVFGDFPLEMTLNIWNFLNSLTLTFIGSCVNIGYGINSPLWYLCILLICYIVFYFCLWFSNRINIPKAYFFIFMLSIGTAAVCYNLNLPFLNLSTGRGFSAFFGGSLLFYLSEFKSKILIPISFIGILTTLPALVLNLGIGGEQWGIFTFVFFPSILILALNFDSFFNSKFFKFLGGISFEIYIWHFPAIILLMCLKHFLGLEQVYTRTEMFIFTLAIVLFAIPMYLFIEKTLVKIIRKKVLEKIS